MTIDRHNAFSLAGEVALITGATRGIGFACATALGKAGASVAIGCRDVVAGRALADDLRMLGLIATAVHMDMLSLDSISQAISTVE